MIGNFRDIQEGMKVFDLNNREIGKVEWVKTGEDDPDTPEVEAAAIPDEDGRESLVDMIADAFRTDDLPEELQERLLEEGFVRIDSEGLFAADRYVMPDQISAVSTDKIMLNVTRDQLLKRQ